MEWVSELGFRPVQPTTIKQYLCHVRSLHIDNDLPFDACEGPQVQRLIRGIKRYFGERDRNPVLPITIDILRRIVATIHPATSVEEATFDAAVKTVFSAFLRCGEFTEKSPGTAGGPDSSMKLARGDVTFLPDAVAPTHIRLTVPASKTDPFRKGVSLLIAAAPHAATCAVRALQYLYSVDSKPPNAPLFSGSDGRRLSYQAFLTRLHLSLSAAGVFGRYTGRSFRRGAASSAAAAGYSDYEIQLLGRWRSDAYRLYIDVPHDRLLHLSARLHWAVPDAQPFAPPELRLASTLA
jgi:hypothetical protein